MRWAGIDEAGYGPNLGPMVMTAVVAEGPDDCVPDVWVDLQARVARAGDRSERLWVDDSKAILRVPSGRSRLEATCLALLAAVAGGLPGSFSAILEAIGAGTLDDVELTLWLDDAEPRLPVPAPADLPPGLDPQQPGAAFAGAPWRIVAVHSVVVGPARFNAGLAATGSKARVHFDAFSRLIATLWDGTVAPAADQGPAVIQVRGDKHGGRHYYYNPLLSAFPDVWIDRGPEGPALSTYTMRTSERRLELRLEPRADAADGLVALASIVSKTVRERWMDHFNAHWIARIPGLAPTAGYPGDAQRFRQHIEPACAARGLDPIVWWRLK